MGEVLPSLQPRETPLVGVGIGEAVIIIIQVTTTGIIADTTVGGLIGLWCYFNYIPDYYTTVYVDGSPYYYCDGSYFQPYSDGYIGCTATNSYTI